jgi:regulator of protease activity HflC (stomatin/prohibitin superfamily)
MIASIIDLVKSIWWSLIPIAVVNYNEGGLRVRMGKTGPEHELSCTTGMFGTGWHWRWWIIDDIDIYENTWDYIDLSFGDMPTADGTLVTFSANVEYRITSVYQLWSTTNDPDENLSRLALGKLSELVTEDEDGAMAQGQKSTRTWMRKKLQKEYGPRGVEIGNVFITTWVVRPRVIRLLSDGRTLF